MSSLSGQASANSPCGSNRGAVVEATVDQHRWNAVQLVDVADDLAGFEPGSVMEVVGDDAGEGPCGSEGRRTGDSG